ncbi:uncharacterized protein LOC133124576 isoform X2 [Conger conger]|uniref:uncharacterized protein LOC133124576 isoform X2 n=1 Tax=Conger conger TaxID=82655 RepID=UPI002A5AC4FA|nr:uncharacterized protein LOC133124576 isoform X2 [Conger conger]
MELILCWMMIALQLNGIHTEGIHKKTFGTGTNVSLLYSNRTFNTLILEKWNIERRGGDDCQPSDEGNYTCSTHFSGGVESTHFHVTAESNVNASEVQHRQPPPTGIVIWMVCSFGALLTLIVLSSVIIWGKLQSKRRKKLGERERFKFHTEEIQDMEPYITYTEKTKYAFVEFHHLGGQCNSSIHIITAAHSVWCQIQWDKDSQMT